ncbi:MAG: hypothetical protein O7E52_22540 [Candidatus Poribacteria bacterium]|nr:hypothetical protein [Candidatus Poribacteria bacterium]
MPEQIADALLESAKQGIGAFLESARENGQIDQQSYEQAVARVFPSLQEWWNDDSILAISPHLKEGLRTAISEKRWEDIVNAFRQSIRFGTGGIRGMMAFDRQSVLRLSEDGTDAPILKGPNTINDIVLLITSAGVARFGKKQRPPLEKVVIGYDSRVRGHDFAKIVAQLFLAAGYTVYFFDEPCPYPEMTFAIPYAEIKGDMGILISASHNDYRYNGYKLSCCNGSQFDPEQRDEMYNKYIAHATTSEISLMPFDQAPANKLVFLGGHEPVEGFDYLGREDTIINIHKAHSDQVKAFLLTPDLAQQQKESNNPLCIAYCAFHGAGRRAVPRLLRKVGFTDLRIITEGGLNDLDGLFPSFEWRPGKEQQPDPGDERAARTAVNAFKKQGDLGSFDDVDILIGTDPDADRCGVVAKVPQNQRALYDGQDWTLLSADSMWALVLWYRFQREIEQFGRVRDAEKKFIVLSHTTSDSIALLARKHGLGVIKTWVGFAALAAAVRDVWEQQPIMELTEGRHPSLGELCHPFVCDYHDINIGQRSINVAAMEQSNGFSILGGPPPDERSLGEGGHVRDKDGTLAALLVAEIAAWAKQQGTTIFELIDQHIHLDPDVGLFVNHYEPDPMDGEYPGIQGDRKKKDILRRALGYFQFALAGDMTIANQRVTDAVIYRTGKYDAIYQRTYDFHFPDEGIRFYLSSKFSHITVRPSGTGNSLRFHIQLHEPNPGPSLSDLVGKKEELFGQAKAMANELRSMLKAPRS